MSVPTGAPGNGDGWVAFLLAQVGGLAAMRFGQRVQTLDLKPQHAGLLRVVAAEPGLSQQAVAEKLQVLPSALVVLVDHLEGRDLLERRQNAKDRRQRFLFPTDQGRRTMGELGRVARSHGEDFLAPLTPMERRELGRLLRALAAHHELEPGVHPGYRNLGRRPRDE